MLGIARNVAYRTEDLRTYEGLLDLRARARDLILVPLEDHDADLRRNLSGSDYLPSVLTWRSPPQPSWTGPIGAASSSGA